MPILHPYTDAPKLPAEGRIELRSLLRAPADTVEIEIGPGRGGFLFDRLTQRNDVALVGLEIRAKWAKLVDDKVASLGHGHRARVFAEDAKHALTRLEPDHSVSAFFVNFPDPWWKKRHQKRLVLGTSLLVSMARLLKPRGELFIQTDVEERATRYENEVSGHPEFEPWGDAPPSATLSESPYEAKSHRERRAIADQIPVYRLRYRRRPL